MGRFKLNDADHTRVTQAVADAERGTDGEIVTIVTDRSDAYHDVGLHYAVAGMLLWLGLSVAFPALAISPVTWAMGGWYGEAEVPQILFATLIVQVVLFLAIRYALAWMPLRIALTPRATLGRRVRRRALQFFKASAEKRTASRVGILIYLSLAEHRAEIIADAAIHGKVPPERWGDAMALLVGGVKRGDSGGGLADAVAAVGVILAEYFPKTDADVNELPDRLIEL